MISTLTGKSMAIARLPPELAVPGTKLTVQNASGPVSATAQALQVHDHAQIVEVGTPILGGDHLR